MISMDIETTFYEYLKKYAENKTSVKYFNLKHISLLPNFQKVFFVVEDFVNCDTVCCNPGRDQRRVSMPQLLSV